MSILGLALLAWGGLNQQWLATVVIGILLAGSYLTAWRWALTTAQYYRLGDFVSVLFIAAVLYFSVAHSEQRPVFIILEWLPAFFLPILLAQIYSQKNTLPLGTLFYSMRKRSTVRAIDFKLPYAMICLLAAGAQHSPSLSYFILIAILFSAMLWPVHSKNATPLLWFFLLILSTGIAYFGQIGLKQLHKIIEEATVEWLSDWQTDPFKSMTSIGDIGALKLSNKIEFRVRADQPMLLIQASYDRYLGQSWLASERTFSEQANTIQSNLDKPVQQLEFFQPVKRSTILALPLSTIKIRGLKGAHLQYTALGAVKLTEAPDFVNYQVDYSAQKQAELREFDLQIPDQHQDWISQIKQQLNLDHQSPQHIAQAIQQFFQQHYYYSLFLGNESDSNKALATFMLQRKAGHCEYFAVASVLLLRSYDIPARLANGYAMQEYSETQNLYIVRRRHAHAWAIAAINGHWQAVDATPSQWLAMEEEQAEMLQPVYDLFSAVYFQYQQWRYQQALTADSDNDFWLLIAMALSLFLAWRLVTSRRQLHKITPKKTALKMHLYPGKDSEIYLIENRLSGTNKARKNNESMLAWAQRINNTELIAIVKLHYQYRFDQGKFSALSRKKLKQATQKCLYSSKKR